MTRFPRPRAFEVGDRPDADGVAGWERHNAAELVPLVCAVPESSAFRAREVNLAVGRTGVAHVRGTAHVVHRDPSLIDADPVDAVIAYATLRGRTVVEHAGGRLVLHAGQMLLCDADDPVVRRFDGGVDEFAVKVARTDLAALTGATGIDGPRLVDAAGPSADGHAAALLDLTRRALSSRTLAQVDDQAVLELVSCLATDGGGRALRHLGSARAAIARRLTDPALAAVDVADEVGVSERHLSRLFADTGSSVPQYVLGRRLDLAYAALEDPRFASLTTAQVAERSGFTSTSHFAKTFHRRFETSAGSVRRAARRTA